MCASGFRARPGSTRQRKESLEWSAARTGRTALRFLVT
jgi:hypothetical protein